MTVYVPGTGETDPKKQNMSLQALGAAQAVDEANIATNTTNIATNTTNIATNTANIAINTAAIAGLPTPPSAATKANQQAGSSNAVFVSPLHQQDHPSAAKAWAYITNNGTAAIQASYNVASISRTGTGTVVITFTTAFAAANYATIGSGVGAGNTADGASPPTSASTQTIITRTGSNVTTDQDFNVVFFGTQ